MILVTAKGKTKAQCECGAQSPKIANGDFGDWKRSEEGKAFYSAHTPHGKTRKVETGGRRVSLDEDVKRFEKKRTKASPHEINQLAEHFEKRT